MSKKNRVKPIESIIPEDMTAEEIEAFNAAEKEKRDKLVAKQANNRAKQRATQERDPDVIRGIAGEDCIRCISVRRIGIDNGEMSEVDEEIDIPKSIAKALQKNGAIQVSL